MMNEGCILDSSGIEVTSARRVDGSEVPDDV